MIFATVLHIVRRASIMPIVVWVATVLAVCLGAQSRMMVDAPGTWKPWKFEATVGARTERSATAADVKAFEGQLVALRAILQRAPGVATPKGFSVEVWGHLAGYRAAPGQPPASAVPLGGGASFGAFPIFEYERGGKTIREDTGETALLQFVVNQVSAAVFDGEPVPDWTGSDSEAFLEPPARGLVAGFHRFGDVLIIKTNPRPVWVPVSMEQAIGLTTAARAKELAEYREAADRIKADLADARDPAKKAERFAGFKTVAASQPDPQKFLADMEQVEKEAEARLVADLAPDGGGTMTKVVEIERAMADAGAWLKELSPADRAAPACFAQAGATPRERFRAGSIPGCVPAVQPNPAFFDRSLPRSVPQVVVVPQVARCMDNQPERVSTPAGCPANRQLLETLDKQALLEWLK